MTDNSDNITIGFHCNEYTAVYESLSVYNIFWFKIEQFKWIYNIYAYVIKCIFSIIY